MLTVGFSAIPVAWSNLNNEFSWIILASNASLNFSKSEIKISWLKVALRELFFGSTTFSFTIISSPDSSELEPGEELLVLDDEEPELGGGGGVGGSGMHCPDTIDSPVWQLKQAEASNPIFEQVTHFPTGVPW